MEHGLQHELISRGVANPDEFSHLAAEAIRDTCCWYDEQDGRVGPGVLVTELRRGGRRERQKSTPESRSAAYFEGVWSWLEENFPEWTMPGQRSHPAAFVAVMRLHTRHGRGSVTKAKDGRSIRAAVKDWEKRYA